MSTPYLLTSWIMFYIFSVFIINLVNINMNKQQKKLSQLISTFTNTLLKGQFVSVNII